jgi:hypothetical protein
MVSFCIDFAQGRNHILLQLKDIDERVGVIAGGILLDFFIRDLNLIPVSNSLEGLIFLTLCFLLQ